MSQRTPWLAFGAILILVIACIGAGGIMLVGRAYQQRYTDRIYPGVSVYGVDLSGLTVNEAAAAIPIRLPAANLPITLRDGERAWSCSWANVGMHIDPQATAQMAYRIGREGTPGEQAIARLQALVAGRPLSPVVILPAREQAAAFLAELAPEILVPPANAGLSFHPTGVIPIPPQAGKELDIEATLAMLPHTLEVGPNGITMRLITRQVEPAIGSPGPAQAQAEALLAQPFTLIADDPLTGFQATWNIDTATMAAWLTTKVVEDENGAHLVLTVHENAVQAYLTDLGSQLTDEVALDVARTASAVRTAVEAAAHQATIALTHPPHTYTVQPGDTLMSIAYSHGFPLWRLMEANPGVESGALQPGQQITIPSVDVLFPLPLITNRRIVVDISDLRLYAYEGNTLVYEFPCSTGIDSSPTIPGMFQVLSKEENAYASSWDLWMPHFIGIYRSGPDFTNGIHGLPTLSNGTILWGGYLGRQRVSYGCIVIGLQEAAMLYNWAELGTLVIVQE